MPDEAPKSERRADSNEENASSQSGRAELQKQLTEANLPPLPPGAPPSYAVTSIPGLDFLPSLPLGPPPPTALLPRPQSIPLHPIRPGLAPVMPGFPGPPPSFIPNYGQPGFPPQGPPFPPHMQPGPLSINQMFYPPAQNFPPPDFHMPPPPPVGGPLPRPPRPQANHMRPHQGPPGQCKPPRFPL